MMLLRIVGYPKQTSGLVLIPSYISRVLEMSQYHCSVALSITKVCTPTTMIKVSPVLLQRFAHQLLWLQGMALTMIAMG